MPAKKAVVDVVIKKRSRVTVENGGTIWYDETLPAGTHEVRVHELVPGATGKTKIAVNGRTIAEIDHN
ncbi:MAG TPA: hypothetical protein V6C81_12365 [Planktothrix sp.]|jgi:hypothetical protein